VCFYAHAFVDTPFGDLNADGAVGMTVTFEEQTKDYALEGYSINYGSARTIDGVAESARWDEAHFYRECSNKGICNRKTGQCDCFPGYEGEGCQRTTCPGTTAGMTCSGHGLCVNAYFDEAEYNLWDQEKTMKCACDAGYGGPDCSLRQCPQGADPVEHSDKVTTSLQKITWGTIGYKGSFFVEKNAFDQVMSGPVYWTITAQDDMGDTWTTNMLSINYGTNCDTTNAALATPLNCMSMPLFNRLAEFGGNPLVGDNTDFTNFPESNPDGYDWYATPTIADNVNASLQALPNGAVQDPYVWSWYTRSDPHVNSAGISYQDATQAIAADPTTFLRDRDEDIKYPTDTYEGFTQYWNSPSSRYPDFNSNGHQDKKWWDCGRIDGKEDVNRDTVFTGTTVTDDVTTASAGRISRGDATRDTPTDSVVSTEGLCVYVSSKNYMSENYKITYSYNSHIFRDLGTVALSSPSYFGALQVGQSHDVTSSLQPSPDASILQTWKGDAPDTGLIGDLVPLVTVENVGLYRYWDVNTDGYPARSYQVNSGVFGDDMISSTFSTSVCSKRGLCDEVTGECNCFSGYTGVACSAQNAIAYSS